MKRLVLALVTLCAFSAPALAAVIRVPQDHATIQAAVTAALPGDKVIIRPGTYPENVDVNAKTNLLIRGQGLVTVNPAAGSAFTVQNSNGIRIKGLSLVTTGFSFGIVFTTSPNGFVAKCRALGALGLGAVNSPGTRFVACKVNSTANGIAFGTPGTYTAERCIVTSAAGGHAFNLAGDTVNLVRCKVNYTGVPTMSPIISKLNTRLYAERCRIQTSAAGANVYGFDLQPTAPTTQHELIRNRVEGCNASIQSTTANHVTCFGNVLSGSTAGGIALQGTNHQIVRNKILLGPGLTLGVFFVNATSSTVSRNKIQSGGAGVVFLGGAGNTATRNKLKNLTFGVSVSGNGHTIGPKNRYKNCGTPINDGGVGTIILDTP